MNTLFSGKRVLVTGAAGFIGSHVTDHLLQLGASVTGVDTFITGRRENIAHLEGNSAFQLIEANVSHRPDSYLPEDFVPDLIFHLASPASPPRYQAHPIETYLVNSIGTHNLLQLLVERNSSGRFLFAGTSEAYGDPLEHPQKESYWGNVNPNGPRSCYDEAKRLGETICGVHHRSLGIDIRIVRIFNTYGPRMDPADGRVIPNLTLQALRNETMTLYGDGTQTRSYCYVDDLVEGLLRLMETDAARGETVNLGNPGEFTIAQTAEIIRELVGAQSEIVTSQPLPQDDPIRRQPDVTKARELLGWEPKTEFRVGLEQTIPYFRHHV